MKKKFLPFFIVLLLLLSGCSSPSDSSSSQADPLSDASAYLQEELDSVQALLVETDTAVEGISAGDQEAYTFMNEKLNSKPYFYDILVTDSESNVTQVATEMDMPFIGLNLKSINRHNELFVSTPMFIIKQDSDTDNTPFIYASVPRKNGGWVIAYIDPYTFGAQLSQFALGQDLDIGILDTNGTNIYTNNMTEIGKNILTDPIYDSFVQMKTLVQNSMIPESQGEGSYTFNATGTNDPVQKEIKWNTVTAFDQQLRIYANTEPGSNNSSVSELRPFTTEELGWLDTASDLVYDEFTNLENLTDNAITAYQEFGSDGEQFTEALAKISQESALAKSVVFVDNNNVITTSYPSYFEGISFDLYDLDIPSLTSEKQPFITEVKIADIQTPAMQQLGFITPVIKDDTVTGYIVAQVRLYDFAAYLSNLKSIGENVNFMLVNSDGTILYDGDIAEVGQNIYEDDLYSEGTLQDYIQNEFRANNEGESHYDFYGAGMTEIIPKEVSWKTLTFMWNDFKLAMNSEWKPAE